MLHLNHNHHLNSHGLNPVHVGLIENTSDITTTPINFFNVKLYVNTFNNKTNSETTSIVHEEVGEETDVLHQFPIKKMKLNNTDTESVISDLSTDAPTSTVSESVKEEPVLTDLVNDILATKRATKAEKKEIKTSFSYNKKTATTNNKKWAEVEEETFFRLLGLYGMNFDFIAFEMKTKTRK